MSVNHSQWDYPRVGFFLILANDDHTYLKTSNPYEPILCLDAAVAPVAVMSLHRNNDALRVGEMVGYVCDALLRNARSEVMHATVVGTVHDTRRHAVAVARVGGCVLFAQETHKVVDTLRGLLEIFDGATRSGGVLLPANSQEVVSREVVGVW